MTFQLADFPGSLSRLSWLNSAADRRQSETTGEHSGALLQTVIAGL